MTELRKQINNIVEEIRTKIIPENIKEGVTIFGVEGTLKIETDEEVLNRVLQLEAEQNEEKDLLDELNGEVI